MWPVINPFISQIKTENDFSYKNVHGVRRQGNDRCGHSNWHRSKGDYATKGSKGIGRMLSGRRKNVFHKQQGLKNIVKNEVYILISSSLFFFLQPRLYL